MALVAHPKGVHMAAAAQQQGPAALAAVVAALAAMSATLGPVLCRRASRSGMQGVWMGPGHQTPRLGPQHQVRSATDSCTLQILLLTCAFLGLLWAAAAPASTAFASGFVAQEWRSKQPICLAKSFIQRKGLSQLFTTRTA